MLSSGVLRYLWQSLECSRTILFWVGAAVERFRRWVLRKELDVAKKALTAGSHFETDGHAPDVPPVCD